MANRTLNWVGTTTAYATASNWIDQATGLAPATPPDAGDNCRWGTGTGATNNPCAVTATAYCRSADFTGYTGSFSITGGGVYLVIGDGTTGTGNIALNLSTGMTINSAAQFQFVSSSTTQQTVETAGKTIQILYFSHVSGSWLVTSSTGTLNAGNLYNNAGTVTLSVTTWNGSSLNFAGSSTKVFDPGSTAMNITAYSNTIVNSGSNTTIRPNTAIFTVTTWQPIRCNGLNWNGASIVVTAPVDVYPVTFSNSPGTWANFTRTCRATKSDSLIITGTLTVTGTFTAAGNSTTNRLLVASGAAGVAATINAAVVSCSNVDLMDITAAGSGNWDLSAITGLSGDCGGNTGITFTPSVAQAATGTASFTWSTHGWTTRVPLPQDDVTVANAFVAGRTVTIDMPRIGRNVSFAGVSGSPNVSNTWTGSTACSIYGSLTLSASLGSSVFPNNVELRGRGTHTITSAGKTPVSTNSSLNIIAPGGTYTPADPLTVGGDIQLTAGTLTTDSLAMQSNRVLNNEAYTGATTWNLGTTTWTISGASGSPTFTVAAASTFNGSSSTIVFGTYGGAASTTRTFNGGGKTFGTVRYTVTGTGQLTISGNNTFTVLDVGPGRSIAVTAGAFQTVIGDLPSGSPFGYQYQPGATGARVSTPDSAALSITGDITVRLRVSMNNWFQNQALISKYNSTGNQISWQLTTGAIGFNWFHSSNGSTTSSNPTQVAPPFTNGETYWIEVSRVQSTGVTTFKWAPDSASVPTSWTTLASTPIAAGSAMFDSTAPIELGSREGGTSGLAAGRFYRAQILSDSTLVFDADFTTKPVGANSFTESSANAATVSITGLLAQVGDGRIAYTSSTGGSAAFIRRSLGTMAPDYATFTDIRGVHPYQLFRGANTVDVSGNSNLHASATTYTHRQTTHIYDSNAATSIAATLPYNTKVGSLVVAEFISFGSTGGLTPPTGWDLVVSQGAPTLAPAFICLYVKVGDGTPLSASLSQVTARARMLAITEFDGFSNPLADGSSSNVGTASNATSINTTATTGPTPTSIPVLGTVLVGNNSTLTATVGATNGWLEDHSPVATTYKMFRKEVTALAAQDTTVTWTSARAYTSALLGLFKDAPTSGSFLMFM